MITGLRMLLQISLFLAFASLYSAEESHVPDTHPGHVPSFHQPFGFPFNPYINPYFYNPYFFGGFPGFSPFFHSPAHVHGAAHHLGGLVFIGQFKGKTILWQLMTILIQN